MFSAASEVWQKSLFVYFPTGYESGKGVGMI